MSLTTSTFDGKTLTIALAGSVNTKNAPAVGKELMDAHGAYPSAPIVLDCTDLEFISSAGLRVVLRLKKVHSAMSLVNVSSDVYQVFDMTGFTSMMDIRMAYRQISVEGCRVIGRGAKGVLYRLDAETVCKVYLDPDSLDDIHRERELARSAFVAGIPTAISFDVVRVGDSYGSVFELLDAETMGELLARGVWDVERVSDAMAELLIQMAHTKVDPDVMPPILNEADEWLERLQGVLAPAAYARFEELLRATPREKYMVHGDFHMGNVMVQDDEPLLIDMDTLSHGNGVFDLESAYSAYVGRGLLDRANVEHFLGVPFETSCKLWELILRKRFPQASDEELRVAEDKVRLLSAMRLMGRPCGHKDIDEDLARRTFALYGGIIEELLPRVDTLAV